MNHTKTPRLLFSLVALAAASGIAFAGTRPDRARLSVAVAEPDVQAIVIAVGGNEVDTFSLFKGCILRENLTVEPAVKGRLAKAGVIVWTGFLNESAAITASLDNPAISKRGTADAKWIDVSKDAVRANIPTSSCFGNSDPKSTSGDPFFWLNPKNGSIIARNVAEGLSALRPEKRGYFLANANAFKATLDKDIARWKEELKPLRNLRIFSAQCGWQNFSKLGGPTFVVCKGDLGSLPTPEHLVDRVKELKAQVVIVDPNMPPEYGKVFREQSGARVIEVASSIENLPGSSDSYSALFDNFVHALQKAAKN